VDGNPLEGLNVLTNRDNFKIVMKEGQIYKNILEA
jgi:imidazolonepropionase-like amidohydrolase